MWEVVPCGLKLSVHGPIATNPVTSKHDRSSPPHTYRPIVDVWMIPNSARISGNDMTVLEDIAPPVVTNPPPDEVEYIFTLKLLTAPWVLTIHGLLLASAVPRIPRMTMEATGRGTEWGKRTEVGIRGAGEVEEVDCACLNMASARRGGGMTNTASWTMLMRGMVNVA